MSGGAGTNGNGGGGASGGMSGAAGTGGRGGTGGASGGAAGQGGSGAQAGSGTAGSAGSVQFRANSYTGVASQTSIPRATAIQGGDLMLLAHLAYDSTAMTSSATSLGFALVATEARSTGQLARLWIYQKVAAGTTGQQTTEPTQFTITNSEGRYQDLLLFSVSGASRTAPVLASTVANGASTAMSVPGVNVTRAGSLGLWWKMGYHNTTTTNPSGWSMIASDQDNVNDVASRSFGIGQTGAITATQNGTSTWVNVFVVLQP